MRLFGFELFHTLACLAVRLCTHETSRRSYEQDILGVGLATESSPRLNALAQDYGSVPQKVNVAVTGAYCPQGMSKISTDGALANRGQRCAALAVRPPSVLDPSPQPE